MFQSRKPIRAACIHPLTIASICILLLSFTTNTLQAANKQTDNAPDFIRVLSHSVHPNWSNPERTGYGDQIISDFMKAHPNLISYQNYPINRVVNLIAREQADCIWGTEIGGFEDYTGRKAIDSDLIAIYTWVYATSIKKPKIESFEDLRNKVLTLPMGVNIDLINLGDVKKDLKHVVPSPTPETAFKLVLRERADVALAPVILKQFPKGLHYSESLSKGQQSEMRLVCAANNGRSKQLIDTMNIFLNKQNLLNIN